jgi:hypothetical protein
MVKRDLDEVFAMMTGVAVLAFLGGVALWRLGRFWPDAQWTGLFVGVIGVSLYLGTIPVLRRLYRQIG